jgi:pyruvate/2-oxoglutarate dehydrogenase complex dihydrolipoamide dehydrogenase (E3) component
MREPGRTITVDKEAGFPEPVVSRGRLAGVHAIGHNAGELIHEPVQPVYRYAGTTAVSMAALR